MKKILIALMCVIMVVCFMPTVAMADTGSEPAAKIGEAKYGTLQEAVNAATDGQIVIMMKDVTEDVVVAAAAEKTVTIDLNGKKLTNVSDHTIINRGTLTIVDNSEEKTGTVDNIRHQKAAVRNEGTLSISGGIFTRSAETPYKNNGDTAVPSGGTANSWYTIENIDIITDISGGTFRTGDGSADTLGNNSSLIRNGDGTTVGTITKISGGEFISAANVIKNEPESRIQSISGGTFTMDNSVNLFWGGNNILQNAGTIGTITGGLFEAKGSGQDLKDGAKYTRKGIFSSGTISEIGGAFRLNMEGDNNVGIRIVENGDIKISDGSFDVNTTIESGAPSVMVSKAGVDSAKLSISGGTFSRDVRDYIVAGTQMVTDSDGKFVLAPADSAVAKIGNVGYTNLQAAVEAADDGQTITLLKDVTVTTTVKITKNLTLDLGRYNVTGDGCRVLNVIKGKLELTGTGTVTAVKKAESGSLDPDSSVIRVGDNAAVGEGASKASAELIIGKDVIIAAPDTYGVTVFGSGTEETVTVYGTINATGTRAAISGNGSSGYGGTTINIEDGAKVTATQDAAIYHPQAGTLNINGGKISGTSGIEAKSGTINVTGTPTIEATGDKEHVPNRNGTSTSGYAIAVVDNSVYVGSTKADIKGGTFKGEIATLNDNQEVVEDEKKGTIVISGGSFDTKVDASYLASGFVQNADGTVKVQAPTGGGGGGGAPAAQKPTVEAAEGTKVTLSTDGTTATITVEEGYEITDVTVNGVSKGAVTTVSGLKTGDKLVVTAAKKETSLTEEEQKKAEAIRGFKLIAKSKLTKTKSGKKAIRITWNTSEYKFDGVEVWRSTKRNSGYGNKPMWTIKAKNTKYYYNTAIKKGKTYYYKLRGYVEINGQKYYTPFSSKAYRTVR